MSKKGREAELQAKKEAAARAEAKKKHDRNVIIFTAMITLAVIVVGVIVAISLREKNDPTGGGSTEGNREGGSGWYADITIKEYGTITVFLDSEAAPKSVDNFVALAQSGFYDGLTFHRIREGFMMQGGAPDSTKPTPQTIEGEFSANGHENNLKHVRGVISMARAQDYNSASSQFFIVQQDSPHLDGKYAAFGYVTNGIEIVDKICGDARPTDNNGTIPQAKQPVIEKIRVYMTDPGGEWVIQ